MFVNAIPESIPFHVAAGTVTIRDSYQLSVTSAPITGVAVTGSKPGTTDYTAACLPGESVSLSMPNRITVGGTECVFIRWVLDGVNQPPCRTELQFTVSGDHAASAVWTIRGDLNGDCRLNVLDLIAIRNRLNADPSSGDNALADVNSDGRINVLDLIQARNRLGAICGPAPRDCGAASLLTDVITGESPITVTIMAGGLAMGDIVTVTFNGTVIRADQELDSIAISLTLDPGKNCFGISAVSEGPVSQDGFVEVLVVFSSVTAGEQVQIVSIPVGAVAKCTIAR